MGAQVGTRMIGVAFGVAAYSCIIGPTLMLVAGRLLGIRPAQIMRLYPLPAICFAVGTGLCIIDQTITMPAGVGLIEQAILLAGAFLLIYCLALYLDRASWRELLGRWRELRHPRAGGNPHA